MEQKDKLNIASELEFSKNIIDGILGGSKNAVEEASSKRNSFSIEEKKEMIKESQEAARITELNSLAVGEITNTKSTMNQLVIESLEVIKSKPIPKNVQRNIRKISENTLRYRKYLLKFLRKYS